MQKLPAEFTNRMKRQLGDEYERFLAAYGEEARAGLRVNTEKISAAEFADRAAFPLEPVRWAANGFYYQKNDPVAKHPYYHAGLYYIQEPSAMLPASRLPVCPGDVVLDLCAAPGGKATELSARLGGTGLLVANDVSASRARALLRNLTLWGSRNACVTAETPQRLLDTFGCFFDKILVDAPCSGEGMMRREQMAIDQWSEKLIAQCAATQREILPYAVGALREGGYLIYSTCTYNPRENEDNVRWLTENFPLEQVATPFEGLYGIHSALDSGMHALRFFPHLTPGEGLFVALMRKTGEERGGKRRRPAKIKAVKVPEWIKGNVPLKAFERIAGKDRRINVIPEQWADDIIRISSALNCIYTGTEAAENKGRDMIPTHDSFLASSFVRGIYPELQLSEEAAIDYLRCNNPLPQPDIPRGLCAAVCEGAVIGRANNLGTRINNLYPKEYRIRNL